MQRFATCDEDLYGEWGKLTGGDKHRTLHESITNLRYILGSFDPLTLFAMGWLVGSIMTWFVAWIVIGEMT